MQFHPPRIGGWASPLHASAGFRRVAGFEELDLVGEWRSFLDAPSRFFKHLLDD
jgi:hypothetical protein